jgi:DNA-binding Lrp family transcriptional regulator
MHIMAAQPELDRTDCEIIRILQSNGRISNKRLAERLKLAPSTTLERVKRLVAKGVVRGFHAEVEPSVLGIGLQAMIAVRLQDHSRSAVDAFREHAISQREVLSLFHVSGSNDFLVHVAVRDAQHLREVAMEKLVDRPEVAHLDTSLIFEHRVSWEMPQFLELA